MTMLNQLGRIDIYLLDQVLKGRISQEARLLDAGCGHGRNIEYFIRNDYEVWAVDKKEEAIEILKGQCKAWNTTYDTNQIQIADLVKIPFPTNHFDWIISSAVLHFAENRIHFIQLFEELIRVLRPNGILWFRMTTKHTLVHLAQHVHDDVYALPDGSVRYLLDLEVLQALMEKHQLHFVDPFKTVNVADLRTMATVVLMKKDTSIQNRAQSNQKRG